MSRDLFSRYIWIIDTLRHYGSLTRKQINDLWVRSSQSDGNPFPRRTFYSYLRQIEELFKIQIQCNQSTFEYYITDSDDHYQSVVSWMLNSASIGNLLNDASAVADRIFLEDVPSARMFMPQIVDALKQQRQLKIDYRAFDRSMTKTDIVIEPYFMKIFRQRWYVTGLNVKDNRLKTYALDRITDASVLPVQYKLPNNFSANEYIANSFGVIFDEGVVSRVALRVAPRRAKYFRSVPLHHSQNEVIHDNYSIFYYTIKTTPDFVQEILSYGPDVVVLQPPSLRSQIIKTLEQSQALYLATQNGPAVPPEIDPACH
ncbi:MAG: WYL domain-containing protein [Muribaculum sp.]|nr:WYL domain-containing protein [Muribaculaceae bacterium]MCM1080462.1 WYL domain-containing protein [Muribaculum sp.]